MKDKYTIFIVTVGITYFVLYTYLFSNMQFWITDIFHCYKVMDFADYLKDHIHIFFYIFLFFFMSFYIIKMLYFVFIEIFKLKDLKNYINLLKVKQYKNVIIINTEEKLAFNFLNKIVISTSILKDNDKQEKKSIFLHEKGHLINKDSYKMLLANLLLSLFPAFIKNKLTKNYILSLETKADKYASKFIGNLKLAKSLLKIKTFYSYQPMMNNFTEERLKILLENGEVKIPKIIHILIIVLLTSLFISIIYKTCLCGIM